MGLPHKQLKDNLAEVAQKLRLRNFSEIALRSGLKRDNIWRYMNGTSFPTMDNLEKLARGLRVEASDLVPCLFDGTYDKDAIMTRKPRGKTNATTITTAPLAVYQSETDPTKAHLLVDMLVPWATAAEIMRLLKESEAADAAADRAASG